MTRWHFLKNTLAAAMLCGLMLSPRLWLTARSYPHVPVWSGLPALPTPWDWLLLGVLLASLGAVVAASRPRLAMLVFVLLAGLWSLWDQTRWQPWFYQYLFMFAALALGPAPSDPQRGQASLNACRLIVASLYVWSGLQKVNVEFATGDYPWLMEPMLKHLPETWHESIKCCGWQAAFFECGIGLGLLVWPLRALAIAGALAMHLLILFSLGPSGHDWNTVVWPWNLAMMIFVVVLFARTRGLMPWHILWPRRFLFARVVLLLFGVMPLLNFFECWDSYLSAALYSGNIALERIFISQEVYDRLPADARRHARWRWAAPDHEGAAFPDDATSACPWEVDLLEWSMAEMNVPPYPAARVSRGLARRLADLPRHDGVTKSGPHVILLLEGRAHWRTGKRQQTRVVFPE
jgi:hypothetical protein